MASQTINKYFVKTKSMGYDDFISLMRYVFRFGYLFVGLALALFVAFINFPALTKIYFRQAVFFLVWFVGGLIVLVIDDQLPEWQRLLSIIFNIAMIYGFAASVVWHAFRYREFEPPSEMPERPSDALFKVLKQLPRK